MFPKYALFESSHHLEKAKYGPTTGEKKKQEKKGTRKHTAPKKGSKRGAKKGSKQGGGEEKEGKKAKEKLQVGRPCRTYKHDPTEDEISLVAKLHKHIVQNVSMPPDLNNLARACFVHPEALRDPDVVNLINKFLDNSIVGMLVLQQGALFKIYTSLQSLGY